MSPFFFFLLPVVSYIDNGLDDLAGYLKDKFQVCTHCIFCLQVYFIFLSAFKLALNHHGSVIVQVPVIYTSLDFSIDSSGCLTSSANPQVWLTMD